jgi:hypothetical protein
MQSLLSQSNVESLLSVLLTAGILGVVAEAIISHRRAAAERKRELHGLLRLLLVEIKSNDRRMEVLLSGHSGTYSPDDRFEDEVWKDSRVRLAQLFRDEHHFHHLNLYYRNNANLGNFAFEVASVGWDIRDPEHFPAQVVKEILEQQRRMSSAAVRIILEYVPEDPRHYHTIEYLADKIKRMERELKEKRSADKNSE